MRRPSLALVSVLAPVAVAAVLAAAGTARTPPTAWTRVSGPDTGGDQLGLARGADGTLHVIWNRGNQPPSSIFDTRFAPSGARLATTTVSGSWDGAKNGLALLVMPDTSLRLFVTGAHSSAASNGGISTFTAPASGASWTLQPEVWGGPFAASAAIIGATLTKGGQVVTGWRGAAAEGIPPASIPQNPYAPFQLATHLATDGASGAVVLAGVSGGGKAGVFVQQILPAAGKVVVLPDGGYNNDFIMGMSARLDAAGVFVAYADTKSARLYRYGAGSRTLARGPYTSATVCAGPDGRLWLAWGDSNDELFVTRSNRAAGTLEPIQKLTLPENTTNGLRYLQCEGSAGPLDLFAEVADKANGLGFWHTHVLARFAVRASVARGKAGSRVTISVRDAGDAVPGAIVAVGGRRLRAGAGGTVTLTLRPGRYAATVSARGYASASTTFHV